jgi:hypothetical protein
MFAVPAPSIDAVIVPWAPALIGAGSVLVVIVILVVIGAVQYRRAGGIARR